MQLDMHYYGTYAMARTAGLSPAVCQIIATAAQFVDDNAGKDSVEFDDGARLDIDATAHHTIDVHNTDAEDQRKVWVPFHFLPGNEGSSYTERLRCRKDSAIAQELVARNLSLFNEAYAQELIGVTAHVYADTFSHYGFSGVSSRSNKIVNDSIGFTDVEPEVKKYILGKAEKFKRAYRNEDGLINNIKSWLAESMSGALGHGAVLTYPDRPYLNWHFNYETPEGQPVGRPVYRANPETFLEGCRALHAMFRNFADKRADLVTDDGREFNEISSVIEEILNVQAPMKGRITAWQERVGELFVNGPDEIPKYDAESWHTERRAMRTVEHSSEIISLPVYRFYQAVANHRHYVLRELLPQHGLVVD